MIKTKFVIFRTTFVIIRSYNPLYIKTFPALKTYKHIKHIKQLIYKTSKHEVLNAYTYYLFLIKFPRYKTKFVIFSLNRQMNVN
jgi:hypothetical protein